MLYSGLEGYCKAGAEVFGDNQFVLGLCKDFLPERTRDQLALTWRLSHGRAGRGSRLSVFERSWLNTGAQQNAYAAYRDEAEAFYHIIQARPEASADGFATIQHDARYEEKLREAPTIRDCKALARIQCENDAIDACVNRMIDLVAPENRDASFVTSLVMRDGFPVDFSGVVIPEVKEGLIHEGYRREEINDFGGRLASLARRAHEYLTDRGRATLADYRQFLAVLVAGLIYGPNHPRARLEPDPTRTYIHFPGDRDEALDGTTIRLTQVLDRWGFRTGYSAHYGTKQAIFIGRSADPEEYVRCCAVRRDEGKLDAETLDDLLRCEKIVFPVGDTYESVSRVHGMLLCEEDVWRLYDLGSTNGTSLKRTYILDALGERATDENVQVEGFMQVRPGDRLRFGAPVDAEDANVYRDAATMMLTAYVDPAE